jgi:hypothetical protein
MSQCPIGFYRNKDEANMKNNKRKTRSNPTATPNIDEQKAPELNPVIVHTRTNIRIELGKPPAEDPEEWWFHSRWMEFLLQKFELDISKIEVDSLATLSMCFSSICYTITYLLVADIYVRVLSRRNNMSGPGQDRRVLHMDFVS